MTSSPISAARSQYLLGLLSQIPDPRKRRGRRHPLAGLLAVGIAAVIAGSRSFAAIGQWAADAGPEVLAALGAARGAAEESTFRRAFALVSADRLDQVLGSWLWTRAVQVKGRLVIAIDGKAVRGAKDKDGKAPHLVAALAHGIGAVLGQAAVDAKSNEIPAVRDLLKAFASLAGAVITIDALCRRRHNASVFSWPVSSSAPITSLSRRPERRAASARPATANRRTTPVAAEVSHTARLSSRWVLSGARSPACSAMVQPLRLASPPASAHRYFPACSHGSGLTKQGRIRSSSSRRFRAACRAPILAAAAAPDFVVLTNCMIAGRLPYEQVATSRSASVIPAQSQNGCCPTRTCSASLSPLVGIKGCGLDGRTDHRVDRQARQRLYNCILEHCCPGFSFPDRSRSLLWC
jgi:hypothetical protein